MEEDTEAEEEAAQVPTHTAHQGEAQTETTTPTTAEPGIKGSCLPLQQTRSNVCFRLTDSLHFSVGLLILLLSTRQTSTLFIDNKDSVFCTATTAYNNTYF